MTSSTSAISVQQSSQATATRAAAVRAGALAAAVSVVLVEVVALVGKGIGAPEATPLTVVPLAFLTIVGVAIATAAWVRIGRRAGGARLLARLVPVVLVVSFVPDLLLGVGGTAWGSVATLMAAHVAVFAATIPVLRRLLPPAA